MNPGQMLGHLTQVYRYSMGDGEDMPFAGNLLSRLLYKHLLLNGIAAFPKKVKLRKREGEMPRPAVPEGNIKELEAAINRYFDLYDTGELDNRIHPFFGVMSPTEWNKFHFYHTRHHMRQFGMEPAAPEI